MSVMKTKGTRLRTPGYIFGDAMSETSVNIYCPNRMKDGLKRLAFDKELSVSRYIVGLIINDLLEKDEDFREWYKSL